MGLNIVFINPNSSDEVDKYLPKILAQAIINKVDQGINKGTKEGCAGVKHSA